MASFAMKSAVCGAPLTQKTAPKTAFSRGTMTVRATAEESSRRAFLGAVVSGAALALSRGAEAIDISDARAVRKTGYDIIDEARDLDLPQSVRDGIDQSRADLPATKKRVADSIAALKAEIPANIEKKYWTRGREALRLQSGTLRMDLDTIASSLSDRASKKAARAAADDFFATVEILDDAMRSKDQGSASAAFEKTLAALNSITVG